MPTISLGRVLPVDKGTWVSGAKYVKQDITDYNNKTYYCMKGHVSSDAILPTDRTYWIPMTGEAHDTVKVLSNSATTLNINTSLADYFRITNTASSVRINLTIDGTTVSTDTTASDGDYLRTIMLDINSSNNPTITWSNNITWSDGTPPDLSGTRDVLLFISYNAGKSWVGMLSASSVA